MTAIIGSGEITDYAATALLLRNYERIIAADGGLRHCVHMRIKPDLIVGDIDSVSEEALKVYPSVTVYHFAKDKDETDLELAIKEALWSGAKKITIFGALGLRGDHSIYNLYLLARYPEMITLETEFETIFAISKNSVIQTFPGQVVSLLPLCDPIKGLTTKGLKWEMTDNSLSKNFLSISNVALGEEVLLSIESGDLLCCLNKAIS